MAEYLMILPEARSYGTADQCQAPAKKAMFFIILRCFLLSLPLLLYFLQAGFFQYIAVLRELVSLLHLLQFTTLFFKLYVILCFWIIGRLDR